MGLWGATDAEESKPKNLTDEEKKLVSASHKGWELKPGTKESGNDNPDADPEVLVAIGAADITSIDFVTTSLGNNAGGNVDVKVRFNEAVDITGTPQLTLTNSRAGGGSAATLVLDYLSGTGKFEIIFRKAVGAGSTAYEEDDVLSVGTNVLSLNGGTIKDKGTNTASTITNVAGIGSAAGTLTIGT
jgi:hypothetical protein